MGAALRLTWTLMSAASLRGYNAVRIVGAVSGRYLHWSSVFLSGDSKQCKSGQRLVLSEEDWRSKLTPEQFYVCRQKGTEPPFSGEYYNNHREGVYTCTGCGAPLFSSKNKYDSGSGWPSFYDVLNGVNQESSVVTKMDTSHGMVRVEVLCKQCDSHLGHVFDDGPAPTGNRYCINSASLNFIPDKPDD